MPEPTCTDSMFPPTRPDPTVTDRDRELARKLVPELSRGWDAVPGLERLFAQARQEGREEGRRDGVTESAIVALCEAIYLRKHLDDQHQADGAERVEKRLTALLDQPAPEAKE